MTLNFQPRPFQISFPWGKVDICASLEINYAEITQKQ